MGLSVGNGSDPYSAPGHGPPRLPLQQGASKAHGSHEKSAEGEVADTAGHADLGPRHPEGINK